MDTDEKLAHYIARVEELEAENAALKGKLAHIHNGLEKLVPVNALLIEELNLLREVDMAAEERSTIQESETEPIYYFREEQALSKYSAWKEKHNAK